MAAPPEFLKLIFNHITLPPRLPGRQDMGLDRIERALVQRLLDATVPLSRLPHNNFFDEWESLRRSLETCKRVNSGGRLTKASLLTALRELRGRDFIALHVAEQNAGLIIRLQESGGSVLFESFEASPLSEDVLASRNALRWDFPGSVIAIPITEYENTCFQDELATFLEKASTESIKRFAAHTNKAGSFAFESRDTVDPALITQMLMTLLEVNGRRAFPPLLQKRVRDDVCWNEGGEKPWRRCPFWLVLRVAVQRHLSITLGGDVGRIHYKFLICLALSHFLSESIGQIDLDLLLFLKTKLCRRLAKLEFDRSKATVNQSVHYEYYFTALGPHFRRSTDFAAEQISAAWENFKKRIQRPILPLPKYADRRHLFLSLPSSKSYILRILNDYCDPYDATPSVPLYRLPEDYQPSFTISKPGTVFANRYFKLCKIEIKIETEMKAKYSCFGVLTSATDIPYEQSCIKLATKIDDYLTNVGDAYDNNPEQKSIMLLTVMEIWVVMDAYATKMFPLLKDYNPGIPSDILDVLLIPGLKDMRRIHNIREYLQKRYAACGGSRMTIFNDPGKGCFAERYYNKSDDSLMLQTFHQKIETAANRARKAKEQEWQRKTLEFKELVQEASEASCVFTTDQFLVPTHDRHCKRCYLDRKVRRFTMHVHEHPLPADPIHAKAVVFELNCPRAFAAYRDCSWQIISTLAIPTTQIPASGHKILLGDYTELISYMHSKPSKFTLASITKSFLLTHYARVTFPVSVEDICLPNGLKLRYFDTRLGVWPARLAQTQKVTFTHHCQYTMPENSLFSSLNFSTDITTDSTRPSSYEIVGSQSTCPSGLNVHEYMSFQTLFSGKSRRWPQILVELGSSNVNFSTEATTALLTILALQIGPGDEGDVLGAINGVFRDQAFCKRLADQLDQRLDGIFSNWRDTNCMETLITIALRLFELGNSVSADAIKLLEKARSITSSWITVLRMEIQTATDGETSRRCSWYAFWAALLCRRTFAIYGEQPRLDPAALQSFIECSISLQDNMVSNPAALSLALKNALIRDFKMVYQMRRTIRHSLETSQESLISSITTIWPSVGGAQSRKFSRFELLPNPNQWWAQIIIDVTAQSMQQIVHFHLLEGYLLVMGKPIGKLPPEWRTSCVLQQLFGNQSLLTCPSSLPGMTYMLAIPTNGHQIHIGFRNGELFVRAFVRGSVLELIPPHVFGSRDQFDLPASLVDGCVHWLDLRTQVIEIRQPGSIWKSKQGNWLLNFRTCLATRRNSTLVDPHSPLFERIARTFQHFEDPRHITAFQPPKGKLSVELRRLELSFFVNGNNLFESSQLRSEVDPNQDAGTWYGLYSKLVLREVRYVRDPVTQYLASVPQRQRSILVPMGEIKYNRNGMHISLFVANDGQYAKFTINDVLGRLDCPAEPRLLYLKAMYHAYTSFVLLDPLTGRTGTEEALHCLKSGYCQPWAPITLGPYKVLQRIARLTPQREYYPKDMKVMQTTFWNPQLTTVIQHDGFRAIVDAILEKSEQLSVFSLQKIQLPFLESVGETQLILRSRLRRQFYQRQNSDFDALQPAEDEPYFSRDRWAASQSRTNIVECINIIRMWPSALPTTRDLAGILQNWPNIGGYNGCFGKVLLTDLLDVQWEMDWGSLVNLCRESSSKDAYRMMFLFAIMSFRHDVDMDVVRTLLAFTVLQDLKVLSPPKWPAYSQFRQNQIPRTEYLVQLMKSCIVPYAGDMRSTFGFNLIPKQRRTLEASELAHEKQQDTDSKVVAEFLLRQWPCPEPTMERFPTSTLFLVDVDKALQVIRPEWLRLFQNLEQSNYVSQVQRVLDDHHANLRFPEEPLVFGEQEIFQRRDIGGTSPTLQKLLSKAIEVKSEYPTFESNGTTSTSNPTLDNGRRQDLVPTLSPQIQELETIIGVVVKSKSAVRHQYGEDLSQSLQALQRFRSASLKQQRHSVDAATLAAEISQARSHIRKQLYQLREALEREESAHWLQSAGLWPPITLVTLLENLRSTSSCKFGYGMKNALLSYAQSITVFQRLLRVEDALQKENMQRLLEEQENIGHSNWKPHDFPDWLLLEVDSNILFRPGQVDVALATISPESGSNSVLQMNMGQGKTSCIMPMVAAVLADGSNLLRVVVPKALLLQTAQLLHARLGGLLGRELRHIPFSRKTPTRSATIETFHRIHRDIQKSSGVLLALPEHLLSFMLSGLQRLSDARIPEARSMIKVQNWLSRRARDVLDECDNILALRTQLIYPSGSQKTVDGHPHRWEIAEALLARVDGHLYNLHKAYPHSIEVVPRQQGGFPVAYFLRKDVEDELINRLVDDIYHGRIPILPLGSKSDQLCIKKFISEAKVSPEVIHSISNLFPKKPALKQAIYLLRGLLVHRILLMTLKKRWNVQYGLHPKRDPIAVPYHAKGTPSDQSEWGHPDVAILFTCLAFYYDGLNIVHLRQSLEHVLKSDDPSQVYDRISQDSSLPDSLRDWSAINVDDEAQLKEIWQHVRYKVVVIDYFLNNFVFPRHAKQFQVKLQASGWDIPLFSTGNTHVNRDCNMPFKASTTGFSGTNDWKGMLPLTISQHDLPGLSHTNAEVLTYLLQPRNRKYVLAADVRGRHISEHELLEKIHREGIRVLIDAGAQILEMDNLNLVKAWLKIDYEAPAAIYFDENNKPQVLYQKGHQIPLLASPYAEDLGKCLVYLDEAHTRGTDLKMPIYARGALTLGLGQTKDHTVQAAMRLRQLGTSQSVTFFAPPEVHQSILDLCKKKSGNLIDSYDVICWLLEQTCSGIEQLQPLYFSQGADFCRRAQAALDHSEFLADPQQCEFYLKSLRQVEQQTLEQLYGYNVKAKSLTPFAILSPKIAVFMKELNARRKAFKDTGNAVHGSALQEVEQEREIVYEVEAVREVQNPTHYPAFKFPGLHRSVVAFAKTGRLIADSAAYEQAFSALRRTRVGRKYGVTSDATSGKLYVSTEFTKTVNVPSGRPYDQFQRPVNWILWSTVSEVALIIIPEEAELILQLVRDSESSPTHVLTYAAPVTRKMLHFNDLQYYAVPSLPSGWEAPLWLRTELGIYSGRLYIEYPEYSSLLEFLGVKEEMGVIVKEEVDEVALQNDKVEEELEPPTTELNIGQKVEAFAHEPLAFLQEWLAVRRKGQDFTHTPMGFICQGKQLLESHPFFSVNGSDQIRKEVPIKKSTIVSVDEDEGEIEDEFFDEDVYNNNVGDTGQDVDDFDDAELVDEEGDELLQVRE